MTSGAHPDGGIELLSASVGDTRAVAAALVPFLRAGDVVLLGGQLGAGKTAFTQGLARAAGVDEVVTSPTFTLVRPYATAIGPDLLHADVYRLEQLREVVELGLPELLEEGAFAVVEWGERAAPALAPDALRIVIDHGAGSDDRRLTVSATGPAWADRWPDVAAALTAAVAR
ncbi:MAG TPA: tRNA (adenosine(37)-N6)-threonylcarbamoyltransferase complex ATPase subunit type 1 TsaE [Acidimicrobiales bacterium]|nr:tRNA (adenosine(37)-N6)-threonylcarbamoyltransferase complex ATPase subunit type 1 TsaE [Acidimicrobiales bacterium]